MSRLTEARWEVGRAEMLYRDLVPGRDGGRLIASHIKIPTGGPVPDWVHFHTVSFQIIYCWRGWVRVVYEDQGPPFVLEPGDCVLQPPRIRHQVLECSAGLEVVEVASPAEHATAADPDLALPTADLRPERVFDGQRFLRHRAGAARWERRGAIEERDLGIAEATGGLVSARVARALAPAELDGPLVGFVLSGAGRWLDGDAFHLGEGQSVAIGVGVELLHVHLPR
ncbi:MAG TPA: cupin domain-containing protein [Kofleriaceae bacterium]